MRFPSVRILYVEARKTFVRFPFVVGAALAAFVAAVLAINDTSQRDALLNAVLAGQLGIPLLFALAAYAEKKSWPTSRGVLLQVGGFVALVLYYFSLPDWVSSTDVVRFVQLNVALHLLVAFAPYVRSDEPNGFWQYNKTLFLRFLTAALYSAVLFGGLAIALVAIDQLLGVKIVEGTYFKLFVVVGFLFNTWFFLGGIPRDLSALNSSTDYPRGLKVFTQYILVPIVLIYLAILTIYLVKIIVTREWPSGMLGYLVSAVSAAGIFSLLLVHPIREQQENRWIRTLSKWFYVWLFPAIVMLFLAIGKRIAQYGITENRYFLLVLTIWLVGIAAYFTLGRKKTIKLIPASLCLIAFVTSFGPWGAYSVSERSQAARLSGFLSTHGVLVDGGIVPSDGDIPFDDRKEMSAILSYLVEHHGTGAIESWFGGTLADIDTTTGGTGPTRTGRTTERVSVILGAMNIKFVDRWTRNDKHFSFNAKAQGHTYDIAGYDALYRINAGSSQPESVEVAGETLTIGLDEESDRINIKRGDVVVIQIPISALVDQLTEFARLHPAERQIPPDTMRVFAENESIKTTIYFSFINGTRSEDGIDIRNVGGDVFLKLK